MAFTMANPVSTYDQGHLLVAALRLFVHRHKRPPSVRELSEMVGISPEMGHYVCNRLERLGVIEMVDAAFEERLYLREHLKLEELPREEKASDLEGEVKKLKEDRQRQQEQMEKLQASHQSKKKDLFSDLDRQLKEGFKKQKKNPLDDL
jgi:DNA-binding Lrp family transcriptional regulator